MTSYRLPALAAVDFAIACGASNPDVAAKVGGQQLSVTRLADILGTSQAPLEKDVARSIAELWVNYQLIGMAASKGDSMSDKKTMDDALWSSIENMRVKKFYDTYQKTWDTVKVGTDEERYNAGEGMAARHILVKVEANATPEQREAARKKAEAIRAEATPANFIKLTAKSDEPGAAERGGDLGLFGKGQMVAAFEKCVMDIKPGEISPVCQTEFGYHVILRSSYADVKDKFAPLAKQRNTAIADSVYLAGAEKAAKVELSSGAAITAKAIARNSLGYVKDNKAIATYKGGELTNSEFADWLGAYPPQSQVKPQLIGAPDTLVEKFVKQIVRNELMLRAADSTKMTVDTAEMGNLYLNFKNAVTQTWTALGIDPAKLADSAKTGGDKAKIAAARIETFFDKLVKNEAQFVDVPYPVARALQHKFDYAVNDAGLDKVVERAKTVRATADSLKAKQGPPPGAPAPGAAPIPTKPPVPPAQKP
ncbi:MAG: peptidylprolyl isomerase [Gemmatimonadaceae bacterium]|nr:peptidylprolyl isomerase [Gemmatimonadaceae bacterium]